MPAITAKLIAGMDARIVVKGCMGQELQSKKLHFSDWAGDSSKMKNYGSMESGGLDFDLVALFHRKRLSKWLIATNICCIAFLALLLFLTEGKKSPVIQICTSGLQFKVIGTLPWQVLEGGGANSMGIDSSVLADSSSFKLPFGWIPPLFVVCSKVQQIAAAAVHVDSSPAIQIVECIEDLMSWWMLGAGGSRSEI
jgi:hypothetical protein